MCPTELVAIVQRLREASCATVITGLILLLATGCVGDEDVPLGPQQVITDSDVSAESSFTEDLNADSLDVVELIMAIEEEFGSDDQPLEISDEDAEKILTVQDAVTYLSERGIKD